MTGKDVWVAAIDETFIFKKVQQRAAYL